MNIMFLQGAGGTGKSSVAKHLESMGVHTLSSSTRSSYTKLGIDSETSSLEMDAVRRVRLQLQIMEDWASDIERKVEDIKNWTTDPNTLLVVDRGPFDRMAYWLLTMMECNPGSVDNFTERMSKMSQWVDKLGVDAVIYMEFPYPVAWSTQDEFRTPNELQTMALSLMISQMCFRYYQQPVTHSRYWRIEEMLGPHADAATRAQEIMIRYGNLVDNYLSAPKRRPSFWERLAGR